MDVGVTSLDNLMLLLLLSLLTSSLDSSSSLTCFSVILTEVSYLEDLTSTFNFYISNSLLG